MPGGPTSRDSSRVEVLDLVEDRYSRLRVIPWWDQDLLTQAKVVVVGAGALGNEIVKNLALLGVGSMLIVDFDRVEESNLSRSTLFRETDSGALKADSAVRAVGALNSHSHAYALNADVTWQVGVGVFRWADVVICGLDNREARLAVNRACWKANRPWVDGATESFRGLVRVFKPPEGVCYECTLSEQDRRLMSVRDSCGFLAREAFRRGRTPTTPTTSAVIAGIQVQEAIKLLHTEAELPDLVGKGFYFDGVSYDCFTVYYTRRNDCLSHETYGDIVQSELGTDTATLADVVGAASQYLDGEIVVDLPGEMIVELRCLSCRSSEPFYRLLDSTDEEAARCPDCGRVRVPDTVTECHVYSPFAAIPLSQLGFGVMAVLTARAGQQKAHIEMSRDAARVFEERSR